MTNLNTKRRTRDKYPKVSGIYSLSHYNLSQKGGKPKTRKQKKRERSFRKSKEWVEIYGRSYFKKLLKGNASIYLNDTAESELFLLNIFNKAKQIINTDSSILQDNANRLAESFRLWQEYYIKLRSIDPDNPDDIAPETDVPDWALEEPCYDDDGLRETPYNCGS